MKIRKCKDRIFKVPNLFDDSYLACSDDLIEKLEVEIKEKQNILTRLRHDRNVTIWEKQAYNPIDTLKDVCGSDTISEIMFFLDDGDYRYINTSSHEVFLADGKFTLKDTYFGETPDRVSRIVVDVDVELERKEYAD